MSALYSSNPTRKELIPRLTKNTASGLLTRLCYKLSITRITADSVGESETLRHGFVGEETSVEKTNDIFVTGRRDYTVVDVIERILGLN